MRKRAARDARLKAARAWLPSFQGQNVVKGYAKRLGIDLGCALHELQVLRVPLSPAYVERLGRRLQHRIDRRRPKAVSDIPEGYPAIGRMLDPMVRHRADDGRYLTPGDSTRTLAVLGEQVHRTLEVLRDEPARGKTVLAEVDGQVEHSSYGNTGHEVLLGLRPAGAEVP